MLKTENWSIRYDDIYYVDLKPVVDPDQDGVHPVLVLQNCVGNQHILAIIVVAITGA